MFASAPAEKEMAAPMAAPPPAPVMAAPAGKPAKGLSVDDADGDVKAKREDKAKAGAAAGCTVTVRVDKAEGAGDTQALRALVERTARTVACGAAGAIQLRITLDKTGKIAKVEVVSGHKKTGEAMVRKLTGATSATQATADKATVTLTVTIST